MTCYDMVKYDNNGWDALVNPYFRDWCEGEGVGSEIEDEDGNVAFNCGPVQ